MAIYASTALKQHHGEVLAAAEQKPVIVTRYNKKRYIIMTIEFYKQRFAKPSNPAPTPPKETVLDKEYPELKGLSEALAKFQALETKEQSRQSHEITNLPESKATLNMRIDKDVLDFFKSTGRGYQTRINAVLRAFKEAHAVSPKGE